MRIMGIDPGLASCGWAVVDVDEQAERAGLVAHGCISTCREDGDDCTRLNTIYRTMCWAVQKYGPTEVVIEDAAFSRRKFRGSTTGNVIGVCKLAIWQARENLVQERGKWITVTEVAPWMSKRKLCKKARATDEEISTKVQEYLGVQFSPVHAREAAMHALSLVLEDVPRKEKPGGRRVRKHMIEEEIITVDRKVRK
jgi:Holliday junction resolvasome RuvABC endonuclease subunit